MQQQPQQQVSPIKETLKLVSPLTVHDNILTELERNVINFAGDSLRYFSKNWYEYTTINIPSIWLLMVLN